MGAADAPDLSPTPPPPQRLALTLARGPSGSRQVAKMQVGGAGTPSSCLTSSSPMPRLEPLSSTLRASPAAIAATAASPGLGEGTRSAPPPWASLAGWG